MTNKLSFSTPLENLSSHYVTTVVIFASRSLCSDVCVGDTEDFTHGTRMQQMRCLYTSVEKECIPWIISCSKFIVLPHIGMYTRRYTNKSGLCWHTQGWLHQKYLNKWGQQGCLSPELSRCVRQENDHWGYSLEGQWSHIIQRDKFGQWRQFYIAAWGRKWGHCPVLRPRTSSSLLTQWLLRSVFEIGGFYCSSRMV